MYTVVLLVCAHSDYTSVCAQCIPVARGGSRGSVEPPFRVTGSKYFSDTPHITSGISSSFNRAEPALELSAVSGLV